MKKLFLVLAVTCICSMRGMESVPAKAETDPAIMQAHRLKALESKFAPFHEKNSFLDAYMNPSSFVALTKDTITFAHYKHPEITYTITWQTAFDHLTQARTEAQETKKIIDSNKRDLIFEAFNQNPFLSITEKQKYDMQIVWFLGYIENSDFDKSSIEPSAIGTIICNRVLYKKAFEKKDFEEIKKITKNKLRTKPFDTLPMRIASMRMQIQMQLTAMFGNLGIKNP